MISLFIFSCCVFGSTLGQKIINSDLNYHECGIRDDPDVNLEVGVYTTEPRRFPWHVAIYRYNELTKSYVNICGGTIISPNTVLTAAYCVYDQDSKITFSSQLFNVVAGKSSFEWQSPESHVQEVNVNDILISSSYLKGSKSYEDSIAALNLEKNLVFNDFVKPICLQWKWKIDDTANGILQTAGWGLKGTERYGTTLKEAYLEYTSIEECQKKYLSKTSSKSIDNDKLCVLTPNGRKDYDTGGGLVQKKGDRYYLVAVLSTNIDNKFSSSTNITRHLDWLSRTLSTVSSHRRSKWIDEEFADGTVKKNDTTLTRIARQVSNPKDKCKLPSKPGIESYKRTNCERNCEITPGTFIESNEIVRLICENGYGPASNTQYDVKFICNRGTWFEAEPECIKLCPALQKDHLKFECIYGGEPVSCNTYMRPGTIAKFRCEDFYRASYDPLSYSDTTRCIPGGTWSDKLPTCSLVCGLLNQVNKVEATLVHANRTTYGEYPWHVGLFINLANRYEYICGGSLISENFVLTAAHCMFHPSTYVKFKEEDFKVSVGKGKRDYYIKEPYQIDSDVINMIIPETYVGDGTRYAEDIALLQTEVSFKFNHFVLPVCLDRFGIVKFPSNIKGTIVGWGLTENKSLSEDLREVRLPTMPIVQCRRFFREFLQFLTSDKYCVIHQNGSGTEMGDSGGGMTFHAAGQHYVHGIVSIKKTDSNLFSVFTNVTTYLNWIIDSMKIYSSKTVTKKCGIVNNRTAIGSGPQNGQYPWYAGIYKVDEYSDYLRICGGTLIHKSFVLTAAHCVYNRIAESAAPAEDFLITCGKFSKAEKVHRQNRNVKKIIIPAGYNDHKNYFEHDIALIQVDQAFVFNDFVLPVCIDRSKPSFIIRSGDKGTFLGWRLTREESFDSQNLRDVQLSIKDTDQCRKEEGPLSAYITKDKFCVLYANGLGPQKGDSGSGLTFDSGTGRQYIRGISSIRTTDTSEYSGFTNVSTYLDWVYKEIELNLATN